MYPAKYLMVDGTKTSYYIIGSGQPMLFLHGGMVNARTYTSTIHELSKKYTVIAPDIPGFGNSSIPNENWDFEKYAILMKNFMDKLGIDRYVLVGHSFGGGISIELSKIDNRIDKTVLIDTAGAGHGQTLIGYMFNLIRKTFNNLVFYPNKLISSYIVFDYLKDNLFHPSRVWRTVQILAKETRRKLEVQSIAHIPILILWGRYDEIAKLEAGEELAKEIKNLNMSVPSTEFKIIDGNHDWCLLYPTKLSELV